MEIVVDHRALEDMNMAVTEPVTVQLDGISLRSALELVLGDLDLTWTIGSEVLLITNFHEADSRLTTKTYDVGDLVVGVVDGRAVRLSSVAEITEVPEPDNYVSWSPVRRGRKATRNGSPVSPHRRSPCPSPSARAPTPPAWPCRC